MPRRLSFSARLNLALFRAVFRPLALLRPPQPEPIKLLPGSRVLCFSSAGLGDSLLDSVAVRALAETYPDVQIGLVAHHKRTDISRHNPFVSKLYRIRKGPLAFIRLLRELRIDGPWECVLHLSCLDPEPVCLGYLLAPNRSAGLAWRSEFGWLRSWNLDEPGLRRAHLSEQALRVAAAAGAATACPRMVYQVTDGEREELPAAAARLGINHLPGVILQLGGGGAGYRDWPVEHFVELALLLRRESSAPLAILGGPDHAVKARRFAELARPTGLEYADFVGKLSLPLAAALIEQARCLVSTDTGIMHLGFALGTPTVAILHPSPGPARIGPLADVDRHRLVALGKPPGYRRPQDAQMRDIPPRQVFENMLEILQR